MGKPENVLPCGYCGGELPAEPKIVNELKYDPRGAGRFADPDVAGGKHRPITVALCDPCTALRRFTDRAVFTAILGAEKVATFTDDQLQQVGRGLIAPYYEVRNHGDTPARAWSHVDPLELRVALAAVELDIELAQPQRHPGAPGRGCGVCGVAKCDEWRGSLVASWPICGDCEGERLVSGPNAPGRRLRSIFAGQLNKIIPMAPEDLKAFMETSLVRTHSGGYEKRFGYITDAEKLALKVFATNSAWRSVPTEWVAKYRRAAEPAKAPAVISAVGV